MSDEQGSDPVPGPEEVLPGRWRCGTTLGRTLYRDGRVVGMVDTAELAAELVTAANGQDALLQDVALAAAHLMSLVYDEDDTVQSSMENMFAPSSSRGSR